MGCSRGERSIDLFRHIGEAEKVTSFANMPPQEEVEVEESDNASENEYETKDERDGDSMPDATIKNELGANGGEGPDVKKPKLDPKDPLRPRRKKARRACFACQRAHLTCGMFETSGYYLRRDLSNLHFRCGAAGITMSRARLSARKHDNAAY